MDDHVRRVNDLVQFIPDTLTFALAKDGLDGSGKLGLGLCFLIEVSRVAAQDPSLIEAVLVRVQHLLRVLSHVAERGDGELGSLTLGFGPKGMREGRALDQHPGLVLLEAVDSLHVMDEGHGQFIGPEQHLVWVVGLLSHGIPKRCQCILRDNARVCEPLAVRLDSGGQGILGLIGRCLGDVTLGVSLRFPSLADVERLYSLPISELMGKAVSQHGVGPPLIGLTSQGAILTDKSSHLSPARCPFHPPSGPA